MTAQEKVKFILNKFPQTKFSRVDFFWAYIEEFHDVKYLITKEQFRSFWKEFPTIERTLRTILKLPEYKLPPELEATRYSKAEQFRIENKTPS